jgi:hypothetical protein
MPGPALREAGIASQGPSRGGFNDQQLMRYVRDTEFKAGEALLMTVSSEALACYD